MKINVTNPSSVNAARRHWNSSGKIYNIVQMRNEPMGMIGIATQITLLGKGMADFCQVQSCIKVMQDAFHGHI